ncbi:MAG: amino acid ABC transporter permease [Proteobacteria bacterium]|nr:amino acid ABC transporter permease [Pseudomonadota bacterium]
MAPPLLDWGIFGASWLGSSSSDCPNRETACWVFVRARFSNIVYGSYPIAERWRADIVFAVAAAIFGLLVLPRLPGKLWIGLAALVVVPAVSSIFLAGGVFGLRSVETTLWGGLMLTLVVAVWTIVTSIPIGLLLALGRRSSYPLVRALCVAFIELWRGVPLISVLFMAAIMFPLFLPRGVEFDKLLRALVAFSLFNAAYMAEVFRGGLQAIPKGQYEAAQALGLGYWRMTGLVVLPQAIRIVIPGIVNTCIGIFKETTLVLVIGLFDFLATVQTGVSDPAWLIGDHIRVTGYFFVGLGFWVFCFGMSRYSQRLDRQLAAGKAYE